jgi:hypothetical protein
MSKFPVSLLLGDVWNDLNGAERLNPSIGLRAGYLERLERDPFLASNQGITNSARVEKGNKKKFSQERLPLDTCPLMDDPGPACYLPAIG